MIGFITVGVIVVSGLCSLVETALLSISVNRVRFLVAVNRPKAQTLLQLKQRIHDAIASIVILNNVANVLGSIWLGHAISSLFDEFWVAIISCAFVVLIIVFSEIVPKVIGEYYNEFLALYFAPFVSALTRSLTPVHRVLEYLTRFLKVGGKSYKITEDELEAMTHMGHHDGVLEKEEASIMRKALLLHDIKVQEIMTPRIQMKMLDENQMLRDVAEQLIESRFSRIPLFSENADRVTGLLYKTDALKALVQGESVSLAQLKREVLCVPENKPIDKLLVEIKTTSSHTAIILDEYGGTAGIITLEDILEQLVGYIYSEGDRQVRKQYQVIADDEILVEGSTLIEEVNEYFSLQLPKQHFIVSKFILEHFKRFPVKNEPLQYDNLLFIVEELTDRTIERVRIKFLCE